MTVVLRYNAKLELNLGEYQGQITAAELKALAIWGAGRTEYLRRDSLNVITPSADFSSVDFAELDQLFSKYSTIYAPLDFQIFRRSAWVCQSPASRAHVEYWLAGRDIREAMSSATRQFDTYEEAGDWLLLSESELAGVIRREGFEDLVTVQIPLPQPRAMAR